MENIIMGIVYIIIGAVGVALGLIVKGTNTGLTALSSNTVMYHWAVKFIKYAQEYISTNGKDKLKWVVEQLEDLCRKSNVKITNEQITVLVEDTYNEIKEAVKKIEYKNE